jgi:biotin transport system substrate-specific component
VRSTITKLVFTALFAAVISAGAFIVIPFVPIPIVLQNLFTLLAGLVLGPVLGTASVGLFIAAGAIGMPVFANNGSPMGMARILGPTGGYMLGYLLGALAAGLIIGFPRQGEKTPVWRLVLAVILGLLIVYIPGLIRLKMLLNTDWQQTLTAGFFPFIPGDIIKGGIAALIAPRLRRTASQLIDNKPGKISHRVHKGTEEEDA